MIKMQALILLKERELEFGGFEGENGRIKQDRFFQYRTLKGRQLTQ